ncbi:Signal transduction histidine kinase, contains PAS domain [Halalkaliarchaeum sp. AArc-CO]|uniref:histidine kinase N-terminal 7TM domain-containing protein n=1 Tax=Halalkaliarchaeum sp. AArc-CO TaxID=2866381 RepID=UPI00217D6B57|nr:histidine kinase N-terminal 7TM domain-containing protein [Halalkaliarchaeum sp. AArc-CO]UWG49847.1 Signal transduction histidine kinase, contains PAS domain [Halalkaliarchaeum sp. AArc-CO]
MFSFPVIPLLFASVIVGMTAALLAWRERYEPGSIPLFVLLVGQIWWSVSLLFQLQATTVSAKAFWVNMSWVGVVAIPVAWLFFALEYTGRDQYVRTRYVGLVSVVPLATVWLAMTSQFHDLLYLEMTLVESAGTVRINYVAGPWYWIIAGYTYFLGVLGSIPLLELVWSETTEFRGQSSAVLIGTVVPWLTSVLYVAGVLPTGGVDPTPIAFAVSGVAYLGGLTRFRLFGTNPSPNRHAPELLFEEMSQGAVVVDSNDYVVELNEEAARILGVERSAAAGGSGTEIVPEYHRLPEDGELSGYLTIERDDGTRKYDVTVSEITNAYDRVIGRVISLHDVTDYLRQQQRLEVLNRVLRHNIRTETNVIAGYAGLLTDEHDSKEARVIERRADRLEEIGEKGREILELFENGEKADPVPVEGLLEECLAEVREAHPHVTIEVDGSADGAFVSGVLEVVCKNLLENAAEHNLSDDPWAEITVGRDGDHVMVTVADNGPGIDEYERKVLERGTETKLEHGSGLGLWLVKWGTEIAGGRVEFAENEPTGAIVTVEVPAEPAPEPDRLSRFPARALEGTAASGITSTQSLFGSASGRRRSTRSRNS